MNRVMHLWSVDVRQSWRDPITAFGLIGPVALALLIRWALPWLVNAFRTRIDLAPYVPAVAGVLTLFPPVLYGMVAGFLMLDEKDEGTLLALQVSPLSRRSYALYRLLSPVLLSTVLIVAIIPLSGAIQMPFLPLLAVALMASLGAPLFAFLLATLAGNKIEGLALMKLLGLLLAVPIASLFVQGAWQAVLWPVPFYWPFRFLMREVAGASSFELASLWFGGMVVHLVYLAALLRRMK